MKRNAVFALTVLLAVVLLAVSWGGASASTRYTIFGQVLDESGLGLAGVTLFIEGDTEAVVTTDENGVGQLKCAAQLRSLLRKWISLSPLGSTRLRQRRSLAYSCGPLPGKSSAEL